MGGLILILILVWAFQEKAWPDIFSLLTHGKTPPSHQLRMAKVKARTGGVPRGGPVGRWFGGLLSDIGDTHLRHRADRKKVRASARAVKVQNQMDLAAALMTEKMDKRAARLQSRRQRRAAWRTTGPHTEPFPNDAGFDEDPAPEESTERPTPVAVPVRRDVESEEPEVVEEEPEPVVAASPRVVTKMNPAGADGQNLVGSTRYADELIRTVTLAMQVVERMGADLQQHQVTGPGLDAFGKGWGALEAARSDFIAGKAALASQYPLKNAYNDNPDAGDFDFTEGDTRKSA